MLSYIHKLTKKNYGHSIDQLLIARTKNKANKKTIISIIKYKNT